MAERNSLLTFHDLLDQAAASYGSDFEALRSQRAGAEAEVQKLVQELEAARKRLKDVDTQLQMSVREAVKAAELLKVRVPEEYLNQVRQAPAKKNGNSHSNGTYLWQPKGKKEFTAEVSRAMWRVSRGSGGSAGNGEGVLTAAEFWILVREQTGKQQLKPGEAVQLRFPNGREVTVTRLAGEG